MTKAETWAVTLATDRRPGERLASVGGKLPSAAAGIVPPAGRRAEGKVLVDAKAGPMTKAVRLPPIQTGVESQAGGHEAWEQRPEEGWRLYWPGGQGRPESA